MAKGDNYTIIKNSGRTEFIADGDYFSILSGIAHDYGSAGRNWDRPCMLLLNGRIVVSEGITDIAWKYGQRSRQLYDEIREQLQKEFEPAWLGRSNDD